MSKSQMAKSGQDRIRMVDRLRIALLSPWIRNPILNEVKRWIRIRTETNADLRHCFYVFSFP
jgi:hypothetical protein